MLFGLLDLVSGFDWWCYYCCWCIVCAWLLGLLWFVFALGCSFDVYCLLLRLVCAFGLVGGLVVVGLLVC